MNWKIKLFQILKCFGEMEGTWYTIDWRSFGITAEEEVIIKCEYAQWEAENEKT